MERPTPQFHALDYKLMDPLSSLVVDLVEDDVKVAWRFASEYIRAEGNLFAAGAGGAPGDLGQCVTWNCGNLHYMSTLMFLQIWGSL